MRISKYFAALAVALGLAIPLLASRAEAASAKAFAPGHVKAPGESAKGVAPGRVKTPGESAKEFAPGHVKRQTLAPAPATTTTGGTAGGTPLP